MISVIIPAYNEKSYLNHTIENIYSTTNIPPEVIVIDQGGNGKIDSRAVILPVDKNVGERAAMNKAAKAAHCDYLLRIDAHCDFSPQGWDMMMAEVTGEKDITVAVLTAIRMPWEQMRAGAAHQKKEIESWLASGKKREDWRDWERLKGHWYGLVRIIISEHEPGVKGLECKWQKPNRDHAHYKGIHPNMGLTGCGFMLRKSFYDEIGGADESLPKMGAIGEEFALKAWASGGKVQTHMDCMIGHIFGTGGYDTSGVKIAQQKLWLKYQNIYPEICEKFPEFEGLTLVRADQPGRIGKPGKPETTVTVERIDTNDTKDEEGKLIRRKVEKYRYVWLKSEHPDEADWTQQQIEEKYAPLGIKVSEKVYYADEEGNLNE
jgi:cellulose synthase/poly-beta-1,6-N-acetylglucosamine synthase-like glycosyltransferase